VITVQYWPMAPAVAEAGLMPRPGAHHPSSVPVEIGLEPPCSLHQPVEGGLEAPCNPRQVCPPSAVHAYHPQRVDVPVGGVLAPQTAIQEDQIVGQWVRAPNSAPGVRSSSSVPAAKQEGFIAEARGICPTVNADRIPSCMFGILNLSSAPQVQTYGIATESKGQRPLFKIDKYNGTTSLETYLLQFRQLATYLQWTERDTFYNMSASLAGPAA